MIELPAVKVLAVNGYCQTISEAESLPDLKEEVKVSMGVNVRRVTRFVQLALIGAGRCRQGHALADDTAIYLSSCRGDTEVAAALLDELVREEELPSPLTFVNSVSNAACFHVTSALGLQQRSNFITNRFDPIAAALKLAAVDIARGECSLVLVGSVDAAALPLAHHRRRLHVDDDVQVGEASHWLMLAAADHHDPVLGCVRVGNFASMEDLQDWIAAQDFEGLVLLAAGQHLRKDDEASLAAMSTIDSVWDYRQEIPYYDSPTGAALQAFFSERKERVMLHVNSDPARRFSVIVARR